MYVRGLWFESIALIKSTQISKTKNTKSKDTDRSSTLAKQNKNLTLKERCYMLDTFISWVESSGLGANQIRIG